MFAAASGARLAHRHNKATVKKQLCSNNIEGLQVHYKAFQRHQHVKYSDTPGIHGQRKPQRCHNYTSKLYSSDSESVLKLSSSYIDLHGRIPKFGHVDFEGKAAWQDRELGYDTERRESFGVGLEGTHRFKQKEAHKRWVKRNRIHDSTFGDCSSEDEDIYGTYGAQNAAANALLYIGLGTMCIGMIIAFVGTGEKGFKTIELRLIGPSLIGAGVMIIILRVMLCVCPSKCFKFNKHKHKNSTNKLNSEEESRGSVWKEPAVCGKDGKVSEKPDQEESLPMTDRMSTVRKSDSKKRVSIAEAPSTSSKCDNFRAADAAGAAESIPGDAVPGQPPVNPVMVWDPNGKASAEDVSGSQTLADALHATDAEPPDGKDVSYHSDVSLDSLTNGSVNSDSLDSETSWRTVRNASKFEAHRIPKNATGEIVLNPSNLGEIHDSD